MKKNTLYLISVVAVILGIYTLFYLSSYNNITENFAKYSSYAEKYAAENKIPNSKTAVPSTRLPVRSNMNRGRMTVSETRFRR